MIFLKKQEVKKLSEYIKVSVDEMKRDAQSLRELTERLPNAISQLEGALTELAGCWEGPARNEYLYQISTDIQYMTELYRFLSEYIGCIEEGSQKYLSGEQDAYLTVNSI